MKNFSEQPEMPRPQENAKARFLATCLVLVIVYLGFSFAFNAFADPPTSPYTPGETLAPTCSPTSTNCTVERPLFSTSTLPMGAILFMNDNSGTVTAATSTLFWNASGDRFVVGSNATSGLPFQTATTSLFYLGANQLIGGNPSGTFIGINATASYNGDFMNFEVNSSSKFDFSSAGNLTIAGITSSSQATIASSTITSLTFLNATSTGHLQVPTAVFTTLASSTGITFTNATGSGNFQVGTGIFTTKASSSAITFTNATGSGALTIFKLYISSSSLTASGTKIAATSTLIVCAISNCNIGAAASTTNTVAYFASVDGTNGTNSIIARGYISAGANDVGEYIPVDGGDSEYGQGDVVSIEESSTVLFGKSQGPYDPNLAGVITTTAGLVAGGGYDDHGTTIISLAGRVPVNVTMENGPIHVGDFLTSSDIPGVAMRSTQPGRVIGMALADDLGDPNNPNATSQVMMFVNPGWSLGNLSDPADIASSSWALAVDSNGQVVIDQFTAYVQAALAKLGIAIQDGVATLQELIANKVTTNELCVQGTCINGTQFSNLVNGAGITPDSAATLSSPSSSTSTPDTSTSTTDTTDSPDTATTTDTTTTSSSTPSLQVTTSTDDDSDPSSSPAIAPAAPTSTPTDTSTDNSDSTSTTDSGGQ